MPIPPRALWLALSALVAVAIVRGPRRQPAARLPEGTLFVAALQRSISTADARPGDAIELWTVHPVRLPDGGFVPSGAVIRGQVTQVRSGRGRHAPEMLLRFTSIDIAGERYAIASALFHVRGRRERRSEAGIDRGAAGVALHGGGTVATDGRELTLAAGRRLSVRLAAPAAVEHRQAWLSPLVD